jgi:hypothetical protein
MDDVLKIAFGSCCVATLVAVGLLALYMKAVDRKIVREGRTLFAPIVQANNLLFEWGKDDLPAQVLICFEPDSPQLRRQLLDIASTVATLKTQEPATADAEFVAEIVRNETPRWGRRDRLPDSFTGGLNVYAVPVTVIRAHLPGRALQRKFIFVRGMPGIEGDVVMISDQQAESPNAT